MSAVSSNSSDREVDALRRAQRGHEPSMEEILASIRTIITDDRDPAKLAARMAEATGGTPPAPVIVYSNDAPPASQAEPEPLRAAEAADDEAALVALRQPERSDSNPSEEPKPMLDETLTSLEASRAVTAAFEALSATVAARTAEIAEGMVREMLRPMLKAWLDENLPETVERLVRAEIERLARGTRA
jgi:cell pole-organizing protein PopZ